MPASWKRWNAGIASAAVAVALIAGSPAAPAVAGEANVTSSQILDALKLPKRVTRALSGSSQDVAGCAAASPAVAAVRGRTTRSLSTGERTEVAAITKDKPNIDLPITFEYNSAVLTSSSVATVNALGTALADPEMKDCVFVLGGHTDAKGSDSYNQDLSERRAETVRRILVDKYSITSDRLITVGYGKSHLKQSDQPYAAENRRVQVVNTASK